VHAYIYWLTSYSEQTCPVPVSLQQWNIIVVVFVIVVVTDNSSSSSTILNLLLLTNTCGRNSTSSTKARHWTRSWVISSSPRSSQTTSLRCILVASSHIFLAFSSNNFYEVFPLQNCCMYSLSSIVIATCPAHCRLLYFRILKLRCSL
jgi:hypothetical protein